MKMLKLSLALGAAVLVVGIAAPVEAQIGTGACGRSQRGIQVCWDDLTREECAAGLDGQYLGDGTTCHDFQIPWEGVCLQEVEGFSGGECCLVDVVDSNLTAEEFCEQIVEGEWFPDVNCETVPVELQTFEVER